MLAPTLIARKERAEKGRKQGARARRIRTRIRIPARVSIRIETTTRGRSSIRIGIPVIRTRAVPVRIVARAPVIVAFVVPAPSIPVAIVGVIIGIPAPPVPVPVITIATPTVSELTVEGIVLLFHFPMELPMFPTRVRHLVKILVHPTQVSMDLSMSRIMGKHHRRSHQ